MFQQVAAINDDSPSEYNLSDVEQVVGVQCWARFTAVKLRRASRGMITLCQPVDEHTYNYGNLFYCSSDVCTTSVDELCQKKPNYRLPSWVSSTVILLSRNTNDNKKNAWFFSHMNSNYAKNSSKKGW